MKEGEDKMAVQECRLQAQPAAGTHQQCLWRLRLWRWGLLCECGVQGVVVLPPSDLALAGVDVGLMVVLLATISLDSDLGVSALLVLGDTRGSVDVAEATI